MSYPQIVTEQPGAPPPFQSSANASFTSPRLWSSGLFSCFDDMASCLLGYFCPVFLAMQVSRDLGESACVPCCVLNSATVLRTKMRLMYNIQGSVMDDCLVSAFCGPCVWCQMTREIDYMEKIKQ